MSGGRTTSGEPGVWQIWVDTGGTFTDALGVDPLGRMRRAKILSTSALRGAIVARLSPTRLNVRTDWSLPDDFIRGFRFRALGRETPGPVVTRYDSHTSQIDLSEAAPPDLPPGAPFEVLSPEEAPLLAARILTGTPPDRPLPPLAMRLATTLGTNALLTRKGAPTALFITEGFGDLLRIGTQQRPDLFALDIRRPEPLYVEVVEVRGRLAADGSVLRPLDERAADDAAARLAGQGIGSAAVALLHSHRNPEHEHILKRILERRGMRHVSCSSQLAPFMRLLPRAETAVVNAYLAPILEAYLARVCGGPGAAAGGSGAAAGRAGGGSGRLHVMTSAGGLVAVEAVRPKDMLLSGPAGGVVGAAAAGRRAGFDRVIAFDMGGTSTDVARVDGDFEYSFEHEVGDARLLAPALAIESVAAGGGSVCWFDGHRLRVGPQSAGASPGPACYGAGGPLTLTDVNLLLGRLDARRFEIPIFADEAGRALDGLARAHRERTGERTDDEALLAGLLDIANERMADAIRSVSLRRGYDPAAYALLAFGGAGGQHACRVADLLGIPAVLVPPDAGLLSAFGLGRAVFERFAEEQVLEPLERSEAGLSARFERLERRAIDAVRAEGVPGDTIAVRRRVAHVRLAGQDSAVEVPWDPPRPLRPLFEERYAALFGHRPEGRAVELESIRVVASSRAADGGARGGTGDGGRANVEGGAPGGTAPATTTRAHFEDAWIETRAFDRARLQPGARCDGPALIFEAHSATVVEPDWRAEIDPAGTIVLRRAAAGRSAPATEERSGREATAAPEAVRLELFTNRFRAIAAEMGERLRRTAISTNIKERLDFSCALLDARGELVVNAPHIPVHLGGIGLCVQRLRDALPMRPGDVVVTNHPAYGGSHLPDVTVVTPVFASSADVTGGGAAGGGAGRPGAAPGAEGPAPALIGYVASRAHHAEIGGARPGSMPPAATTLVEEGVVIPPLHLVRGGVPLWDDIRRLLEGGRYPSRAVEDNLADLRAAVAANHAGAAALEALAREHGIATIARYMEALEGLAEARVREALAALPPGRHEAQETLDDGSPLRVAVTLEGERAAVDFTGTSGVHPGNLNATPAVVRSVVMYVLRLLLKQPLPLNEGLLRAVSLVIPRGILDPGFHTDPAQAPAIVGGNIETSQRLVDTLLKALGLAACSQGTMNNVLFGDASFGYYETICGGAGAGPGFHGAAAVHSHMTNTRITDPEILEHRYPVRVDRFAIRRGSGGAGRWRGGDGALRELTFLAPVSLSVLSQHRTVPPYGLEGGSPGAPGRQRVVRASGETVALASIDSCEMGPGDRFLLETPGGGGYGTPEPAR